MKKIIFFFITFGFKVMAQDTCATALPVVAGTYVVSAINGTQVPAPICAQNGVGATAGEWYSYTPSQNYNVTITTDLQINSGGDTRFHVYSGTCGSLTCVSGDDDSGVAGNGYLSVATFTVASGNTYLIAFDNKWSSTGFTFQLTEAPYVPPPTPPITFTASSLSTINSSYNIAIVDMNGDYKDDIVGVNAASIDVHRQEITGFTKVSYPTTTADFLPSWSLAAGDINKDGFNDLMYGGGSGVTFMFSGNGGTTYTESSGAQYVFCQRTNLVDVNDDGNLDAFSCHDVAPNVYYLNNGSGVLTFSQGGLGDVPNGGNYGSVWIDYDNDGDSDLFIAKCRGGDSVASLNEMHRNNGSGVFENVSVSTGLSDPIQTWSSAWADYDNDGDMDALVGASSNANGLHKLMINNITTNTFSNATAGSGWDTNTSLGIEHVGHDFDNDGWVDVLGAGNKIMFNNGNLTFTPHTFAFTNGAIGDLNNDGFLDIQNGSTIYYSNGNANKWIKVTLQGNLSNANGIGARVEIYGAWGKQIRDVKSGEGFRYMNSLNVHFGLGSATQITQVRVIWPSGIVDVINNPAVNQILHVIEGSSPLSVNENDLNAIMLYPNPVSNVLFVDGVDLKQMKSISLYNLLGQTVKSEVAFEGKGLDVTNLSSGNYIVKFITKDNKTFERKFIKR